MGYEVELKFVVHERAGLIGQLEALGGRAGDPVRQEDRYFNHPARDFAQTDEAFRIRRDGLSNKLTYKGPKIDKSTKTRREIEIGLQHGEATREQTAEMLQRLGFREVRTVAKTRVEYELRFGERLFHAAIDEVDGAGTYAELETIADENALDAARASLLALAGRLGLKHPERRSYLEILLSRDRA